MNQRNYLNEITDSNSENRNSIHQPRFSQENHLWMTDFISFDNQESLHLNDFLNHVQKFSTKAVKTLPVETSIKQKILKEIGADPFDIKIIKSIYKIGRQWISESNKDNPNVYGECQPKFRDNKFSFVIAMENNAPKNLFLYFLYHEIDHMVWYLGYRFSMKKKGYTDNLILNQLQDVNWEMKTEFFARVNTANQAMLNAENWDFVYNVWTWASQWKQDVYSQSKEYATRYISARNGLYNLLLKKYGKSENAQGTYTAIKEPGHTNFNNLCNSFADFLFFVDDFEGFKSFVNSMLSIVNSSTSIDQAIDRLSGMTGEIRLKARDLTLLKETWNKHQQVLKQCK